MVATASFRGITLHLDNTSVTILGARNLDEAAVIAESIESLPPGQVVAWERAYQFIPSPAEIQS